MPNTYGQGGSSAWRRTRITVLNRDRHRCQLQYPGICIGSATEVDHIVNIATTHTRRLDAVDPGECQSVCSPCHAEKTKQERRVGRSQRKPIPPKHPGLL